MKIHEYQAKELFREYGIETGEEYAVKTPEEAVSAAEKLGYPVVIKAQVLVGGRGKAGGVKVAASREEAEEHAKTILNLSIKNLPVQKVLVARAEKIEQEYYVGFTVDRGKKMVSLMISAAGGVDIEELAVSSPEKILKLAIHPAAGIDDSSLGKILGDIFESEQLRRQAREVIRSLYRLFIEKGCSLVEINPFAKVDGDTLLALDAKINFDDNAVPFHPELERYWNREEFSENEIKAKKAGLHFIGLDGEIGCIVNGAGLAMATMDIIKLYGSSPANFLDVGGSSNPQKVLTALKVILSIPGVKGILFNIFGGITRCDDIARGILMAREQIDITIPIVIRLIGTNDKEGREMLSEAGLSALETLDDAVKEIIAAAQAGDK